MFIITIVIIVDTTGAAPAAVEGRRIAGGGAVCSTFSLRTANIYIAIGDERIKAIRERCQIRRIWGGSLTFFYIYTVFIPIQDIT